MSFNNSFGNNISSLALTAGQKSSAHVANKAIFGVLSGIAGLAVSNVTIGKYIEKKKVEILQNQELTNEEKKQKLEQLRALAVAGSGLVTGTIAGLSSVACTELDHVIDNSDFSAIDLDFINFI